MNETVVTVESVSKQYNIGTLGGSKGRIIESLLQRSGFGKDAAERERDETFLALDDISVTVNEGEVLGIVGRNGAGKTTLLKLLARITEPTSGRIELIGRVGALLEVGTGFHPELTGRENIFLNGGVLGMKRSEILQKFDEIVEFSGVERFLDTPVKRYSSGMHVRLAFAVAAHLEPEILIVDEVLAVGDASFQKKCIGKMDEVAQDGRTILFVSHNIGAVAELCTRAILLDGGKKVADASVPEVLGKYSDLITSGSGRTLEIEPDPSRPCSITGVSVVDENGDSGIALDIQNGIEVRISYVVTEAQPGLQIALLLARNMVSLSSTFDTDEIDYIPLREPGRYEAVCRIPPRFLKAGLYTVQVSAGTPQHLIQMLDPAASFEIEEHSINTQMKGYKHDRPGHFVMPGSWETKRVSDLEPVKIGPAA
jgi:lipopolysaccharide transport system ATP-binding protein